MKLYSQKIFPWLMDKLLSRAAFQKKRRKVLADAKGKVLEIGLGTGLNLTEYPPEIKEISTVDVNPGMNSYAAKRAKAANIKIKHHVITAEKLPMEDGTFDTVVSTWTLCSIPDVGKALREIRRVLKPGGQLIFIEHGLSHKRSIQKWQNRLTPLWKIIGDGCHLNRDIKKILESNGFGLTKYQEYTMAEMPKLTAQMYEGIAVKNFPGKK